MTCGCGYRFIAPVQEQTHGPPDDGVLATVPAQSIPYSRLLLAARCAQGLSPFAMVPAEYHHLSEKLSSPSHTLAGEYNQVTVFRSSLSDALGLAVRLGSEAMHRLMQTVFAVVQQVLQR